MRLCVCTISVFDLFSHIFILFLFMLFISRSAFIVLFFGHQFSNRNKDQIYIYLPCHAIPYHAMYRVYTKLIHTHMNTSPRKPLPFFVYGRACAHNMHARMRARENSYRNWMFISILVRTQALRPNGVRVHEFNNNTNWIQIRHIAHA